MLSPDSKIFSWYHRPVLGFNCNHWSVPGSGCNHWPLSCLTFYHWPLPNISCYQVKWPVLKFRSNPCSGPWFSCNRWSIPNFCCYHWHVPGFNYFDWSVSGFRCLHLIVSAFSCNHWPLRGFSCSRWPVLACARLLKRCWPQGRSGEDWTDLKWDHSGRNMATNWEKKLMMSKPGRGVKTIRAVTNVMSQLKDSDWWLKWIFSFIDFKAAILFNRPGVAGAVLQSPPSFIHLLIHWLIL